jgi:3-isopropylmalate/(R)-2-methylmalate dehydratase large subunit
VKPDASPTRPATADAGVPPTARATPPSTLAQKLLARASGRPEVAPGQSLTCRVDLVVLDDVGGAASHAALLREIAPPPCDRRRVVAVVESDARQAPGYDAPGVDHVYRGLGAPSLVLAQAAQLRPGMLVVGGEGRSSVAGALGALMLGVGAAALLASLSRGEVRLTVPCTLFVRWTGRLADGVSAHDMALHLQSRLPPRSASPMVLEFYGEAVSALGLGDRMTLAALATDLGVCAGLVAPDRLTAHWLRETGAGLDQSSVEAWRSDEDAPGPRHVCDASSLTPQVGRTEPGSTGPVWHVLPLGEFDPTPIDSACLGGAEGAKLDDLRAAARVLAGYRIAPGVQLLIAPASRLDREIAAREGILRRLVEAGATLLPSTRSEGSALDGGTVLSSGEWPVASRSDTPVAPTLRASPFTVAASALRGRLSDAREVLE